jgi:imidazolonepropionase-like amidohydrolase
MGTRPNSTKSLSWQAGVIEEGALADLLLVDGNPIDDIKIIEDPAKNFLVIMKSGRIYKNRLAGDGRR